MTKYSRLILYIGGFLLLEIALVLFVDRPLSLALHQIDLDHTSWINIFRDYTDIGKSVWWLWPSGLGACACALLVRSKGTTERYKNICSTIGARLCFLFLTVATAGLVTDIIKPLVGRSRPLELLRYNIYTFSPITFKAAWNSYPSGHATTAFALMWVANYYFPKARIVWVGIGLVMALSRVMVNAHYISDVCAGFVVSWITFQTLKYLNSKNGMFHAMQCIFPIDRH